MSFLNDCNLIIYVSALLSALFLLYFGSKTHSVFNKIIGYITYIICMLFSWNYVKHFPLVYFYLAVNLAFALFVNCFLARESFKYKNALVVLNNIFIVCWETILLGNCYFYNDLPSPYYTETLSSINNSDHFVSAHFFLYLSYFKTGLEYYFNSHVQPFIFCYQKLLGLIMSGTIIAQVFAYINSKNTSKEIPSTDAANSDLRRSR